MKRFVSALMAVLFLGAAGAALADDAMMSATPMATPGKMMKKMKKKKMKKDMMMKKEMPSTTPTM